MISILGDMLSRDIVLCSHLDGVKNGYGLIFTVETLMKKKLTDKCTLKRSQLANINQC